MSAVDLCHVVRTPQLYFMTYCIQALPLNIFAALLSAAAELYCDYKKVITIRIHDNYLQDSIGLYN